MQFRLCVCWQSAKEPGPGNTHGAFPKLGGTCLEVPIRRTRVLGGVYIGVHYFEKIPHFLPKNYTTFRVNQVPEAVPSLLYCSLFVVYTRLLC